MSLSGKNITKVINEVCKFSTSRKADKKKCVKLGTDCEFDKCYDERIAWSNSWPTDELRAKCDISSKGDAKKRLDCILKDERDPNAAYYYCKTNKCSDSLDFIIDKQIEKTKLDESKIKDVKLKQYNQCVNTKCKKSANAFLNLDRTHNKCLKRSKTYKAQKKCAKIISNLYKNKSDCESKKCFELNPTYSSIKSIKSIKSTKKYKKKSK